MAESSEVLFWEWTWTSKPRDSPPLPPTPTPGRLTPGIEPSDRRLVDSLWRENMAPKKGVSGERGRGKAKFLMNYPADPCPKSHTRMDEPLLYGHTGLQSTFQCSTNSTGSPDVWRKFLTWKIEIRIRKEKGPRQKENKGTKNKVKILSLIALERECISKPRKAVIKKEC